MASISFDQIEQHIKAKNIDDLCIIFEQNPHYFSLQKDVHCNCPGCDQVSTYSIIDTLLRPKYLIIFQALFDKQIVTHENIPDEVFFDLYITCEPSVVTFLIKNVPIERLISIRDTRKYVAEQCFAGVSFLQSISWSYMDEEDITKFYIDLYNKGCRCEPQRPFDDPFYTFVKSGYYNLVKFMIEQGNVTSINDQDDEGFTSTMRMLKRFKYEKNSDYLKDVSDIFELLIANGLDLSLQDKQGQNTIDYICKYKYFKNDLFLNRVTEHCLVTYKWNELPSFEKYIDHDSTEIFDESEFDNIIRKFPVFSEIANYVRNVIFPNRYCKNTEQIEQIYKPFEQMLNSINKDVLQKASDDLHNMFGYSDIYGFYSLF